MIETKFYKKIEDTITKYPNQIPYFLPPHYRVLQNTLSNNKILKTKYIISYKPKMIRFMIILLASLYHQG